MSESFDPVASCDWSIAVPASNSESAEELLQAAERSTVFSDEILLFYVIASDSSLKLQTSLLSVDLQLSAAVGEKTIFSTAYFHSNPQHLIFKDKVMFPMRIPIPSALESEDAKGKEGGNVLAINVSVQLAKKPEPPSNDDFDAVNMLDGLIDDPYFNPNSLPVHRLPFQFKRHSILQVISTPKFLRKTLEIVSPLKVDFNLMHPESQKMILAAKIVHDRDDSMDHMITVQAVDILMPDAVTKPIADSNFPYDLASGDAVSFLFNIFRLSYSNNLTAYNTGSFGSQIILMLDWKSSHPGMHSQTIRSKWTFAPDNVNRLTTSSKNNPTRTVGVSNYDLSGVSRGAVKNVVGHGLEILFTVMPPVRLKTVFTVEILVVNSSMKKRNLYISIPQQYRMKKEKFRQVAQISGYTKLHLPTKDFVDKLAESDLHEAEIFCLENNVHLGRMAPGSCQSVHLHFIALKGNLHHIESIDIFDDENDAVFHLKNCLQIYAE